jgi:2-oxoglutarate ferredoxin oxidoreductase subunit alpha
MASQDYMSRIRGGHNTFAIRASNRKVEAPAERIQLLLALDEQTVELHLRELDPQHLIVADQKWKLDGPDTIPAPFAEFGDEKYLNTAMLGLVGRLIGLDKQSLARAVTAQFARKKPEQVGPNLQALDRAWEWVGRFPDRDFLKLPAPEPAGRRLLLAGHDALALGALSAGLKFYSFYPMTPATSLAIALSPHQADMPLVVEQAEDEIAVINMALGASYAGAPAMVGTSGGGFALMVEGVSLAGMTETPLVIVVGQRPGPATGLPTRTEQGDLLFVLHAGHGEFPRALFAPGSPEQAFEIGRRALFLAEESQGPVFILTDQHLADTLHEVEPFNFEGLEQVSPGADPAAVPDRYRRYQLYPSGVSPRLLPGRSRKLVVVDSDEHDEDGHITEDAGTRTAMVNKRQRKMDLLRARVMPPESGGAADPELLLVSWGSTLGAVREATALLGRQGVAAGYLHFSQVWPLVNDRFLPRLEAARRVVAVEGNNLGQFATIIRRETGFEIREKILRYDGRPIGPEYILRGLGR